MIVSNINPYGKISAFVELYRGSTLALTCTCDDALQEFVITRASESKFFGMDVAQALKITLIDFNKDIYLEGGYTAKVGYTTGGATVYPYPTFHLEEPKRDEVAHKIEVEAFDALYTADKYTFADLVLNESYDLEELAAECARVLGCDLQIYAGSESAFSLFYEAGANFDGSETVREIIRYLAEATQTICYIGAEDVLTFRKLDKDSDTAVVVQEDYYYNFVSGATYTFGGIVNATELGDNTKFITNSNGVIQYIRDNPLLELREDIGDIIEIAADRLYETPIGAFSCDWIGNCLLEIGDKIAFNYDGKTLTSYNLNSTIIFDGIYNEYSEWQFKEDNAEGANNPTNLGEALKQTYARVDKANKEITILASNAEATESKLAAIEINLDSITNTVSNTQSNLDEALEGLNTSITDLRTEIEQTAEQLKITVKEEILAESASEVKTETGFTFNREGLSIEQEGIGIRTQITTDGMAVIKDGSEVLIANSEGVIAKDLHAETFLIIGSNSRLEDYTRDGEPRTGCFWTGG